MATAGELEVAEWQVSGPALLSTEDISAGSGYLGIDYTDNCDSRWWPDLMLGPAINVVSLAAAAGTAATTNGVALSSTMNATLYAYFIRGTKWAKVQVSNMTLISDGTETALAEAATSIVYSRNVGGTPTQTIAIGMDNTTYRVITTVSALATDTHSANNESVINRIMGNGTPAAQAPRMIGLGRSGAANTGQDTVRGNSLTSTVDMDASAWATIDQIGPEGLTFTGLCVDTDRVIVGTSRGPFYVDPNFNHFRPAMDGLGDSVNNCHAMTDIPWLGTVIPLEKGARLQKNLQSEGGIGPERFRNNSSPVQGRLTGIAFNQAWAYFNVYNPVTLETYLCAVQPRQPGDWHTQRLSYYPIATFTNTESKVLMDIGTAGGVRTSHTLIGGHATNMFWMTIGSTWREPDDSNYAYATSGTAYLTELARAPEWDKDIEYVEVETSGCTSARTVTVSLSIDGGTARALPVINSNGFHRIPVNPGFYKGYRVKPQIAFASDASTASPAVRRFRLHYRLRDREVNHAVRRR